MGQAGKKSNNLVTVQPRITKFYLDIHADLIFCCTRYDITSYFWSSFIKVIKKLLKMAFGQNLVVQRFAWPNQLVVFLLISMNYYLALRWEYSV